MAQGAVTDLAPPAERPRLLGLLGAAFGVGFVVGPAIGGLASLGGPHVPFFVAGTVALVNGVIAIRRLPETHRPGATSPAGAPAAAAATRIWTLALVGFIAICAFSGFEATFALFADARFGLAEGGVALVFLGVGLLLVLVQTRLVAPVSVRLGPLGALQLGLAFNAVGLGLLSLTRSWLLLVPALGLPDHRSGDLDPEPDRGGGGPRPGRAAR